MATYRVASLGHRVGTVSVSALQASLHLTIAPKHWRNNSSEPTSWRIEEPGSYVVHEGDFVTVTPGDTGTEAKRLPKAIVERLDALARHAEDAEAIEDARDEQAISIRSNRSAKRTHAGLIRRVADRTGAETFPKDTDAQASDALLALMLLEERLQHRVAISGAAQLSQDGAPTTTTAANTSPVAAVIAAWRFVEELGKHLRQLRRDYTPFEVVTASPRGRILARGFLRHAMTGVPALDCEVDAFSPIVPLAQVFAAALEVLAGGWASRLGAFRHVPMVRKILADAANLRRHLHGIPAPRREEAAHIATYLRLPPMQRAFNAALADARTILRDDAPGVSVGAPDGTSAFVLWFDTAMLWEALLVKAIEGKPGWQVDWNAGGKASHVTCASPWHGLPQGQPDIVGAFRDRAFVIDAKYKSPPKTPSAADKYQLFAYSHLAAFEGRPIERCLLAYAGERADMSPDGWARSPSEGVPEHQTRDGPRLLPLGLSFVTLEQALGIGWAAKSESEGEAPATVDFDGYLASLRGALEKAVFGPSGSLTAGAPADNVSVSVSVSS